MFSESSWGFRPGRSAHEAVRAAQGYVREGRDWVVDIDIAKFFDHVNHDILMRRIAPVIRDKRIMGYPLAWTTRYMLWSDLELPPTSRRYGTGSTCTAF